MTYENDGTVKYTGVDGSVDILCAKAISAGNNTSSANTDIKFKHMLSQVKITLKGNAAAQKTFGQIQSVKLKNIPQNLNITLGDNPSIEADKTTPNLKDITLKSSAFSLSEGETCTTMIMPSLGKSEETKLQIEITTELGESPIIIDIKDLTEGMMSGTTNNINLTFKDKIEVTTSIDNWETGANKEIDYGN